MTTFHFILMAFLEETFPSLVKIMHMIYSIISKVQKPLFSPALINMSLYFIIGFSQLYLYIDICPLDICFLRFTRRCCLCSFSFSALQAEALAAYPSSSEELQSPHRARARKSLTAFLTVLHLHLPSR